MGMITPPSDYDSSSASKPKERQFQVVPVPGTFTRGRWKCFDYRESAAAPDGMLELPKPGSSDTTTDEKGGNAENVDPSEVESVVESVGVLPQPEKTPPPLSKTESESTIVVTSVASAEATPTPTRRVVSGANVAEPETPTQTPARPSFSQPPATINTLEQLKNPRFVISEADLLRNASSATVNWPVIGFDKEATHTIDIKIEQAMDLVKSHLTFAVREEVEEMRATIAQQKARIAQVESENDLLRQFAPPEIVDNITNLVQVRLSPAPTSLETSPEQTVSEPAPTSTPDPTASASAPALPTADAAVAVAPVVIRNEPPTAPELPETTQESPTTSASATSSSS